MVRLTDEEIKQIAITTQSAEPGRDGYVLPYSFARAIEAALSAKQGAVDSEAKASVYMEAKLWEFIDMAAAFPNAKLDHRIWGHVMVYAPEAKQEPVAVVVDPYDTPGLQWLCQHPPKRGDKLFAHPAAPVQQDVNQERQTLNQCLDDDLKRIEKLARANYDNQVELQERISELEAQRKQLLEALKNVTVHLIAAHSLLQQGGKKAAASDKIFNIMLSDYEKSFEVGRAAIEAAERG